MLNLRRLGLIVLIISAITMSSCSHQETRQERSASSPASIAEQESGSEVNPQEGVGGGKQGRAQQMKRLQQRLDQLRQDPDNKQQILKSLRKRLENHDSPHIDEKLAAIGKILDDVIKMDDTAYDSKKKELSRHILQIMRGQGHKSPENDEGQGSADDQKSPDDGEGRD